MNKEDALELMRSSTDILDWNQKRKVVIKSFEEEGVAYRHKIKTYDGEEGVDFNTFIPRWFFNEINSRAVDTLKRKKAA